MFTVKEVCSVTGVTRKTLFHYDRIGLLKPTCRKGKQCFKMYDGEAVIRLLEIRVYRDAGLSIESIRTLMNGTDAERKTLFTKRTEELKNDIDEKRKEIHILEVLSEMEEDKFRTLLSSFEDFTQLKEYLLSFSREP